MRALILMLLLATPASTAHIDYQLTMTGQRDPRFNDAVHLNALTDAEILQAELIGPVDYEPGDVLADVTLWFDLPHGARQPYTRTWLVDNYWPVEGGIGFQLFPSVSIGQGDYSSGTHYLSLDLPNGHRVRSDNWLLTVPEPTTWWLLCVAAVAGIAGRILSRGGCGSWPPRIRCRHRPART